MLIVIVILVALALFSWYRWDLRYRGSEGKSDGFEPTDEVSLDPRTGEKTRVYFNARTGERQYRKEP